MRVLFLIPFATDGFLPLKVARALQARNHHIEVAITSVQNIYKGDDLQDFALEGRLLELSRTVPHELDAMLEKRVRDNGISVIVQCGAADLYARLPALRAKNHQLRMVDILFNQSGHVVDHFLLERAFEGVIVESDFMRKVVANSTSIMERRIWVINSGIQIDLFTPHARTDRQLRVGYVGRLSEEKNPLGFLEIARSAYRRSSRLHFKMFGSGPMKAAVQDRSAALEREGAFQFAGWIPDVRNAFSQIDVLVVPSRLDGRPAVVMEANACGIPVIGSPVGGIPEMIAEGQNGFIISPQNVDIVCDKLIEFAENNNLFATMAASARAYAVRHFAFAKMIDGYERTLSSLCGA